MGLLKNINSGGGLFAFDPDTQQAVDQYAAMPPGPVEQKRGGFLGSGYDGEDIMSMLLRAAAIAQGDLASGAQFGANIGAKSRAAAEAAAAERLHQQRRMEGREDKQWEWQTKPDEAPSAIREAQWRLRASPEEVAAYDANKGPIITTVNGNPMAYPRSMFSGAGAGGNADSTPVVEEGYSYTPGPGGRANQSNWKPVGGGSGDAAGNFPPRLPKRP